MVGLLGLLTPSLGSINQAKAAGASLSFSPTQGEYLVDNTFEVSVVVNSGGSSINAVETSISFPPDKLQVVNPSVGKSFIEIWIAGPSFSNSEGKISFQGGLPTPGVTTSAGLVSTIQFRAKSAGVATLKFSDTSKVLANDGDGTNILSSKSPANFTIKLAPPAGPKVFSTTHEDQNRWYNNRTATFGWESPQGATGYSYSFDTSAGSIPPATVKTTDTTVTINADADGIWYFHIRSFNGKDWGGTTHFAIKIDSSPPATFRPTLDRDSFSASERGLASFTTTDATSGVDRYEVRLINNHNPDTATNFFTEQQSPYQLSPLDAGSYQMIVRAFDRAGNFTDGTALFDVHPVSTLAQTPFFRNPLLNNILIGVLGLIVLLLIILLIRRSRRRRALGRLQNDIEIVKEAISERQEEIATLVQADQTTRRQVDQLRHRTMNRPLLEGRDTRQDSGRQQF